MNLAVVTHIQKVLLPATRLGLCKAFLICRTLLSNVIELLGKKTASSAVAKQVGRQWAVEANKFCMIKNSGGSAGVLSLKKLLLIHDNCDLQKPLALSERRTRFCSLMPVTSNNSLLSGHHLSGVWLFSLLESSLEILYDAHLWRCWVKCYSTSSIAMQNPKMLFQAWKRVVRAVYHRNQVIYPPRLSPLEMSKKRLSPERRDSKAAESIFYVIVRGRNSWGEYNQIWTVGHLVDLVISQVILFVIRFHLQ